MLCAEPTASDELGGGEVVRPIGVPGVRPLRYSQLPRAPDIGPALIASRTPRPDVGASRYSQLLRRPEIAPTCHPLQNAQELLVGSQAPNQSLIEELTKRLQLVDIRHDDLVRGIDGRLESEYWLTTSQAVRDFITQIRLALFATGRAIIQSAYIVEAGEVPFRAARVTDEHRRFLRKLTTADGETLEDKLDELQRVATELGVIEKQREELGTDGQLVLKERTARFAWIRAINALSAVLYPANVDPATILGPIEKEAAKAERRAANKQSSQGGDGTGDDSTNSDTGESAGETDAPEDALDPPVPTDVVDTDDSES